MLPWKDETDRAIGRWQAGLQAIKRSMEDSQPEGWKEKTVDGFDEGWVKSVLLKPATVSALNADYAHVKSWAASLDKFESIKMKLVEADSDLLGDIDKTIEDCKQIVAVVLSYNTLFAKFPSCTTAEAHRQCVKDLKKKLASKKVNCPEVVMVRVQAATSSKEEPAKKRAKK